MAWVTLCEGVSGEEAAMAVANSLREADRLRAESIKASAWHPVSSGFPSFTSVEQFKQYYKKNKPVATTAIRKLQDLGLSYEEAERKVRDWQIDFREDSP